MDKNFSTALGRIQNYLEMRKAQPLSGNGDAIHIIHATTESEAELRLSDLVLVMPEVDDMVKALRLLLPILRDAIPKFDWAKSPLDASAIMALSKMPNHEAIAALLARVDGGSDG